MALHDFEQTILGVPRVPESRATDKDEAESFQHTCKYALQEEVPYEALYRFSI